MVIFDRLFGSSKDVSSSNPQSMHYKNVLPEDRVFLTCIWSCPKCNFSHKIPYQMDTRSWVDCNQCRETKPREGLYETAKGTPISKLKQIKPHYKWSWKLGKAVR